MRVVAPELMASEPAFDPVDVLYSQASFRTRWMLDQRGRGAAWSHRDAAREYEDNAWRASRRQVLQRLGEIAMQPRLVSSAMVEAGALRHDGSACVDPAARHRTVSEPRLTRSGLSPDVAEPCWPIPSPVCSISTAVGCRRLCWRVSPQFPRR